MVLEAYAKVHQAPPNLTVSLRIFDAFDTRCATRDISNVSSLNEKGTHLFEIIIFVSTIFAITWFGITSYSLLLH